HVRKPNVLLFSSRRRHTIFSRDWSSDVCSSDLHSKPLYRINELEVGDEIIVTTDEGEYTYAVSEYEIVTPDQVRVIEADPHNPRSEERRVGKERQTGGTRQHGEKKKKQREQRDS